MDQAIAPAAWSWHHCPPGAPFEPFESVPRRPGPAFGAAPGIPRDPILVIGDRVIETALYMPCRRKDRFAIRRTLADRPGPVGPPRSSPCPSPRPSQKARRLPAGRLSRGGDVFVLGKEIYVGSPATLRCIEGVWWLQAVLARSTRPSGPAELQVPPPGLCALDAPARAGDRVQERASWKGLPPSSPAGSSSTCRRGMRGEAGRERLGDRREDGAGGVRDARPGRGAWSSRPEVLTTPFAAVFMWGGAFRCWHHPLIARGGSPPSSR